LGMLLLSVVLPRAPGGRKPPRIRTVEVTEDWIRLELTDGQPVRMPTGWSRVLATATPVERRRWRLVAGGFGVAWPALGEIVSLHPVQVAERLPAPDAAILQLARGSVLTR
jgi:hypothetical protein